MAAVVGHYSFWNLTSKQALQETWFRSDSAKSPSAVIAVLSIGMSPIIIFGNVLVLLAIWKDPIKKLRSSPTNLIMTSLAIVDLLVGLIVCPLRSYWSLVMYLEDRSAFDPSVVFAIDVFSVNISFGHMFLLTVDRVFAILTPLHYRVTVTNKRVLIARCVCWIYFILFGCAVIIFRDFFAIICIVYILQLLTIFFGMLVMYVSIMFRFHSYSKRRREEEQSSRQDRMVLRRERNVLKAIAIVVCAFLICYMPWFIVHILIYVCQACHSNLSLLMIFSVFSNSLTYANSGLNPLLYAWRLPKYKETFKYFWEQLAKGWRHEGRRDTRPSVCNTRL